MRTPLDALRSLAWYCHEALGDEWEIRTSEDPEAFQRPFCLVGPAGPYLESGSAHTTDVTYPLAIHLWPVAGSDPEDGLWKAMAAEELLRHAFRVGVGLGGPMRVPLWDFDAVPSDRPPAVRGLSDYIRVKDYSSERVRDQDDPSLWEVTADVRAGWSRNGRVPSGTELVRTVRARGDYTD